MDEISSIIHIAAIE